MTRQRISTAYVAHLADVLGPRDLAIVASLASVRLASFQQLQRLHFSGGSPVSAARLCRRTLERLVRRRVLVRLDRRIGGVRAGSQGFVYALDTAGQRLADRDKARHRWRRPWTPGGQFVYHVLATTELLVSLSEVARSGELELLDFQAEPACWRQLIGPAGNVVLLKPDAFIRLGVGEYDDSWFVEVDRATESPTTLSRKLAVYRSYHASGREQARTGVFPQVLFLVPGQRRLEVVIDIVGQQPPEGWELFRVALFDQAIDLMAAREAS